MTEAATVAAVAVIAFGAATGSFVNVVVERTRAERSPWRGRSACPQCGRTLQWFELVPVVSWVLLGGRCRTCRTRLRYQYLAMELITAGLFLLVWLNFGWAWATLVGWAVTTIMLAQATYDAKWGLLPDAWAYVLAAIAALAAWLSGLSTVDILLGGFVGSGFFFIQWLASRGRWVGSGDILLGLGLGLLVGWRMFGLILLLGYMSGAMVAAGQILRRKLTLQSSMPFGPYLLAGGFITWLYGQEIIDWYFNHAIFR